MEADIGPEDELGGGVGSKLKVFPLTVTHESVPSQDDTATAVSWGADNGSIPVNWVGNGTSVTGIGSLSWVSWDEVVSAEVDAGVGRLWGPATDDPLSFFNICKGTISFLQLTELPKWGRGFGDFCAGLEGGEPFTDCGEGEGVEGGGGGGGWEASVGVGVFCTELTGVSVDPPSPKPGGGPTLPPSLPPGMNTILSMKRPGAGDGDGDGFALPDPAAGLRAWLAM